MATNSDVPESFPEYDGPVPAHVIRGTCSPSIHIDDIEPEHVGRALAEGMIIDFGKHEEPYDAYDALGVLEAARKRDIDAEIERLHVSDAVPFVAPRHPNSARFHELLQQAGETHDRKQSDYGKGDDPFANVRASENWGVPGWVGAMVRLNDKVTRLQSLRTKGFLANEGAKDSFMDIAVYALIAYVLYEQAEEEA